MVMLNSDLLAAKAFCKLSGEVIGMQIVSNDLGLNAEEAGEVLDALLKRLIRFCIFHVADVVTQKSIAVACEAKGVLEFASHCKNRFGLRRKPNRIGGVATRATEIYCRMLIHAQNRIVAADLNIAVMQEECIGQG